MRGKFSENFGGSGAKKVNNRETDHLENEVTSTTLHSLCLMMSQLHKVTAPSKKTIAQSSNAW
jgi:hypothetical protein